MSFNSIPDCELLPAQTSFLTETDYPLTVTQRALLERRIRLEKELRPLQFQHSSLQEQLDQVIENLNFFKDLLPKTIPLYFID